MNAVPILHTNKILEKLFEQVRNEVIILDSTLKREKNYTDDYETFKKKLVENNGIDLFDRDPATSNSSTAREKPEITENLEVINPENPDWDQFELNKEKFGVKSGYDELLYTTELNVNVLPEEIKEKADKIEKVVIYIILGNFRRNVEKCSFNGRSRI